MCAAETAEANMPRIFVGGLVILLSLLVVFLLNAAGKLKYDGRSTSADAPALTGKKIEDRAPAGELGSKTARMLLARPAPKTGLGDRSVLSKPAQGGMWTHGGSMVRLEAVGRVRRFYYVEVQGAFPPRNGDIAFEGVREGPTYSGRAFQFAASCAPLAYLVKGSVSTDEATVKLQGLKPRRNAQCDIVGYANEELVFSLTGKL
jgi:hypothetical protein